MYRLVITYPAPDEPQAFVEYYEKKHLPLIRRLPGVVGSRFGYPQSLGEGNELPFCIFEADFKSKDDLMDALKSAAGSALAADVETYSPKGASLMHYPLATPLGFEIN